MRGTASKETCPPSAGMPQPFAGHRSLLYWDSFLAARLRRESLGSATSGR